MACTQLMYQALPSRCLKGVSRKDLPHVSVTETAIRQIIVDFCWKER